ncbi:hypothetical protein [Nonomuraea sp. JJY05]|uniref:hypothetical protein n=1 Tax=Nonomuraea sp. JJY05 TaxID=3350255 RepID=UPI00373F24AD
MAAPSEAVRSRRDDESIGQALARGYLRLLGDYHVAGLLVHSVEYQRTLDAGPALRGRELELRREREDLLAATLAEDVPPQGDRYARGWWRHSRRPLTGCWTGSSGAGCSRGSGPVRSGPR